jgi:hypothetical protein
VSEGKHFKGFWKRTLKKIEGLKNFNIPVILKTMKNMKRLKLMLNLLRPRGLNCRSVWLIADLDPERAIAAKAGVLEE